MFVIAPLGEAPDVLESALVVGMEDMRPVTVDEDAALIELIVHVAADMRPLLHDQHALARPFGKLPSHDGTRKTASHDNRIVVGDVELL